ncbi:MAG: hypothetical protein KDK51_01145 [Deltaproteobacteria bacterium]|nr:hypothetical protein [Deltaproteobacteria bacterium]
MSSSKPWTPYRQIVIETYRGPARGGHGSVRARPVAGEFYPPTMSVECSKEMRTSFPLGTKFRIYAKETSREGSPPFLYTHYSWPYEVIE